MPLGDQANWMNRSLYAVLLPAILAVGAAVLSGCVSAEARWQEAQQHNVMGLIRSPAQSMPARR
jgi:hypothetical protein